MVQNNDLMCKSGPRLRIHPKLKTEDSILVCPHPLEFIMDSDDPTLIGTDKDPGFIIGNLGILVGSLLAFEGRRTVRRRRNLGNSAAPLRRAINTDGAKRLPRQPWAELLIISPYSFNSVRELCESWNSFGHSFVSLLETSSVT